MNREDCMRRALELAEGGRYSVSPNPMVGAVIVKNGQIIGEGFHKRAGGPHAEVEAIASCQEPATGATAYVTLEPCAHHGRTPPCVDALVEAGISRIFIALQDPNPNVSGGGAAILRSRGIEVHTGVLSDEAKRQNEKFLFAVTCGLPFLLLKAGMSLDGKLATSKRVSKWITSAEARHHSLMLREEYDAILVGSGTVRADNPQLTRRLGMNHSIQPWTRVIVDSSGEIPIGSQVFSGESRTIIFTATPDRYKSRNVEVISAEAKDRRINLDFVLRELYARGVQSVIAEGGSILHSDILRRKLWQKMEVFVAPMLIGGSDSPSIFAGAGFDELENALRFHFDAVQRVGDDVLLTAYP